MKPLISDGRACPGAAVRDINDRPSARLPEDRRNAIGAALA
jgi:hypothetical protein